MSKAKKPIDPQRYQGNLNLPCGKFGEYEVKDLKSIRAVLDEVASAEMDKADLSEEVKAKKACIFDFLRTIGKAARKEYGADTTRINYDGKNPDVSKTTAEFLALCAQVEGGEKSVCRAWVDGKTKIKRSLNNDVDLDLGQNEMGKENIKVENTNENGELIHVPSSLDALKKLYLALQKQMGKDEFNGSALEKMMVNDAEKVAAKWAKTLEKNQDILDDAKDADAVAQDVVNG
tara:strand:+ start:728 stop:1426 length:699 start_codon:yes stop_codon:yes gene_type:complete